jgi:thioesterase domain-containing protein
MARLLLRAGEAVTVVMLDTVRQAPVVERPEPPERIRNRQDIVPVWLLKFLRWRIAVARKNLEVRRAYTAQPIGSRQRYDAFYLYALQTMARHQVAVLDVPLIYVVPEGASHSRDWDDHSGLRVVTVGGDHHTMLMAPHVADVGSAIRAARREERS